MRVFRDTVVVLGNCFQRKYYTNMKNSTTIVNIALLNFAFLF